MNRTEAIEAFTAKVREDGTVEGHRIETHYRPCKAIATDHKHKCVRVIADDGPTDIETRILFDTLVADGWTPPNV